MPARALRLFENAARWGRWLEDALLVALLAAMVLIGATQIFMRNFIGEGLGWADESQRLIVLWLALLGAMAATRDRRQLRIDLAARYLRGPMRTTLEVFADFATAVVAGVIGWYALSFVRETYTFGDLLIGVIPAWLVQAILPLAFLMIALRHLVNGMLTLFGREPGAAPR
jgi:TRAP-type C4-dicarboxylate transport system permease small subunit